MSVRVAVVFGGPSAEAAVSRVSAGAVHRALEELGYRAVLLELNASLPAKLLEHETEVVVPATHGAMGEDGCLQGLLEVLGIPYSGAGVLASALATHKAVARRLFRDAGLPIAPGQEVDERAWQASEAARLRAAIGPAVVVKPCSGGSAIGVGRVRAEDPDEVLNTALAAAFAVDREVVVERFEQGEEVTCGVLDDEQGVPHALPPTRIVAKAADWYDFTSRYGTGGSEHECPARFSASLMARIQDVAVRAHLALGVRDLSRVDFVVSPEADAVTLLEVNTLPGMTPTSLFPEAAAVAGVDFSSLCRRLVERALARGRQRQVPEVRVMPA